MSESRLKENPYDVEAWNLLIKENQVKPIEEARSFYERLVIQFPLTGRYWKVYVEHEMKTRNYDKVEELFQRCLMKVLHIELWRCYLNYVKETKGSLSTFREKMARAYDFALDKIGLDINSYQIWNDYVNFLKKVDAIGSYAENQKITAVRRVYQRGVINPMLNIEIFWKDYISYEQSINQIIAEKMIADRSRDYMNARRVAKEYEAVTKGLNKNAPTLPPSIKIDDIKQVQLWKKYINWEKSNPLHIEDNQLIVKRVTFAYEQCILCLGSYPDIWYEYAAYIEENAKSAQEKGDKNQCKLLQDEVNQIYERAIQFLPNNLLIHFAFADFEEQRNRKEKAIEIYDRLLKNNKDDTNFDPTLIYIQYMKFSRRSEGIKFARTIFKRAREDTRSSNQVYICAALMEYFCSKDKSVASKIFELGLKKYNNETDFILAYTNFLSSLNEENNTRVLFERVLTSGYLSVEKSLDIWNKFLEFESNIGDLSSIIKVEKRRANALEKLTNKDHHSLTAWIIDRYRFGDLYPCNSLELKSIGYIPRISGIGLTAGSNIPSIVSSVVSSNAIGANINSSANVPGSSNGIDCYSNIVRPDTRQLLPFKPKMNPIPNSHTIPGGIFPPPPIVGSFLAQLPHPSSYNGPFVIIDELISIILLSPSLKSAIESGQNIFSRSDIVQPPPPSVKRLFDTAVKTSNNLFAHASATNSFVNNNFNTNSNNSNDQTDKSLNMNNKRSTTTAGIDDEDDPDNENSNNMPTFDIYRSRQMQKKVK